MPENDSQTRQSIVDGYAQTLVARYGERFNNEELNAIKQGIGGLVDAAETLRQYKLSNSDEPASVFHPYRAES